MPIVGTIEVVYNNQFANVPSGTIRINRNLFYDKAQTDNQLKQIVKRGEVLSNSLLFNSGLKITQMITGGSHNFSLDPDSDYHNGFYTASLNNPTSVSFASNFELVGDQDVNFSGYNHIIFRYDLYQNKVYYTVEVAAVVSNQPPAPISASTNQDATQTTIQFDGILNPSYIPISTSFVFNPAKTITNVQVSGSHVLLTHAAFDENDTIQVAYNQPGSAFLRGTNGQTVANFAGLAVTNGIQLSDIYAWYGDGAGRQTYNENLPLFQNDTTISFWIKQGTFNGSSGFNVIQANSGSFSQRIRLDGPSDGIQVGVYTDASNRKAWNFTAGFSLKDELLDGEWHHIAITYEYATETVRVWLDGVELTAVTPDELGTFDKTSIATGPAVINPGGVDNNYINDVAIFEDLLTPAEVIQLYNNGTPVDVRDISTPVMYVPFENGTGEWEDIMGNFTQDAAATDGQYVTDTPTSPVYQDEKSFLSEVQYRFNTVETLQWQGANRSISGWFKGVNAVQGTHNWWILSQDGLPNGGSDASRVALCSNSIGTSAGSVGDAILVELKTYDGSGQHSKQLKFLHGGAPFDGEWHHIAVTLDYDNIPSGDDPTITNQVRVFLDGSELTLAEQNAPSNWNKTEMVAAGAMFTAGSNATGGDLVNDLSIINRVITPAEIVDIYNGGTPVNPRTIVDNADFELFLTFEDDQHVDLRGNYTFTEVAAGSSYSSDTP